jgi:hypothetical protein
MNGARKAETVRVMGIKWVWNYADRRWTSETTVGKWSLWWNGRAWLLESPGGATYTMVKQHRYHAMVNAGYKIAEIERWLAR